MNSGRFGVRLPVAGVFASPKAIADTARLAERLGYDSVWVHDYVIWTKELDRLHVSCGSREAVEAAGDHYPPIFYESLSNLAFLAGVTERIRLGVAVLCLPYRDPIVTAKQVATIDALSGGRLELGVGPGAARRTGNVDPEVLGISRATKVARTREYLEAMRRIWAEDSASFDGRFTSFEDAVVFPKPAQVPSPPIWIGGVSEKSLEMVADYADGWLPCWVTPSVYPAAVGDLGRRLAARGRDASELVIGTEIQVLVAETDRDAERQAERSFTAFEGGYGATGGVFAARESATRSERMWQSSLIGSPQSIADELSRYLDAGCTFFELKFIYHTLEHLAEQMSVFASEIAPAFTNPPREAVTT